MSDFDATSHDEFYKSLLGDFLGESEQILVGLNENLLRLDAWTRSGKEDPDVSQARNLLNEMCRSCHSLKGLSNMLGLDEIEELVEHVEMLFEAGRNGSLSVGREIVALMFEAIDRLAALIDSLKDPDAPAVLYDRVIDRITRILVGSAQNDASGKMSRIEEDLGRIESRVAEALATMDKPDRRHDPAARPPVVRKAAPIDAERTTHRDRRDVGGDEDSASPFADLVDEADISSRFMPIFIDETELALDQITQTLLALEGGHAPDKLKQLLVVSHRIKGSAASVGLNRAAKLSHLVEDLVQNLSETGGSLSSDMIDVMLKCADEMRRYVEGLKQGAIPIDHFEELAAELIGVRGQSARAPEAHAAPKIVSASTSSEMVAESGSSESAASPDSATGSGETACPADEGGGLHPVTEELRELVLAAAPIGVPLYAGVATFHLNLPLAGLKAELLYEKLSSLGDVCYFDPSPEQFDAIDRLDCIRFGLATEQPEEEVRQVLRTAGVSGAMVEPLGPGGEPISVASSTSRGEVVDGGEPQSRMQSGTTEPIPTPVKANTNSEAPSRPAETLRVDVDRLDQLMNLAGQLVVSKARFSQTIDQLRAVFRGKRSAISLSGLINSLARVSSLEKDGETHLLEAELSSLFAQAREIQRELEPVRHEVESFRRMHASINELEEAVHQLGRVADEIQKNVMETRMVPIGPLFMRFHRVIRDITRSSGKSVRLVIGGEKTELDKRMIDELGDPLIHLIRNCADHGIEPPEVRTQAGKPAEGTLALDACHRGNNIFIQLSDDGRGLNTGAILRKAVEKGIVEASEAEQMSTHQIHQLIWRPGLSTAERVTETSGRGVGMDIVKSRVESLNGTVDLKSKPGEGTTITIKLPLTLAILPSLMVEVQGDVFAVPMESVAEIVRARGNEVATVHGKPAASVRGRVVSIIRLDEVFQWNSAWADGSDDTPGDVTLVIVRERDEEIGVVVDRVIGEEDVVIKSMSDNYRNVPGVAGASVLGDGRVSLILDTAAVIAMAARPSHAVVAS
ncbi:MAG: hypothetical protein GX621_01535 [Pirellulaceae bacterium]|nr:hypothetical protein [Pirellulaceae bacterium]